MSFELRPYQQDCLNEIKGAAARSINRQLIALPTGTGKTVIFANLPQSQGVHKMLVLAHREELLDQARDKISQINPDLNVQIEQAERRVTPNADVVVASVPTIGRKDSPRLMQFNPDDWPIIVCDEAHHSVAKSYKTVFDHFDLFNNHNRLLIGVTATPNRGDKIGLDSIYQAITFQRNIRDMIEANYLCQIRAYQVNTDSDITGVKIADDGDFADAELSEAVNNDARNILAVNSYRHYCNGRRCLVFCVDKNHTQRMANTFINAGINCGVILGDTPIDVRKDILQKFSSGELKVVANCMVLTEGYDLPLLSSVIMARPTQSGLLYTQCIGRGTRIHPEKPDLIVIDLTDNAERLSVVSIPVIFGLPPRFDTKGKSVTELLIEVESLQKECPNAPLHKAINVEDMRKLVKEYSILKDAHVSNDVKAFSQFVWLPGALGSKYDIYLKNEQQQRISISENLLGKFELRLISNISVSTEIATLDTWQAALALGDNYIRSNFPDQIGLLLQKAKWRGEPATELQKNAMRKCHLEFPEEITKGEANILLGRVFRR